MDLGLQVIRLHIWANKRWIEQKTLLWFFSCCYAAKQLALQVQQERTQVVYSHKEARKRLARRHFRNGPWTHECCFEVMYLYVDSVIRMWNVVLKWCLCMLCVLSCFVSVCTVQCFEVMSLYVVFCLVLCSVCSVQSHLILSPTGARTLKMPVP